MSNRRSRLPRAAKTGHSQSSLSPQSSSNDSSFTSAGSYSHVTNSSNAPVDSLASTSELTGHGTMSSDLGVLANIKEEPASPPPIPILPSSVVGTFTNLQDSRASNFAEPSHTPASAVSTSTVNNTPSFIMPSIIIDDTQSTDIVHMQYAQPLAEHDNDTSTPHNDLATCDSDFAMHDALCEQV